MCIVPALAGIAKLGATLGTIGTAVSAVSGVVGVVSSLQQAKAAKQQAAVNAAALDNAAKKAIADGQTASDRKRRQGAAARAAQKVGMASNGGDVGSTDALSILDETRTFAEEDALAIREGARTQGQNYQQSAANEISAGNVAASNAYGQGFRTILGTAAKVGKKYAYMAPQASYT